MANSLIPVGSVVRLDGTDFLAFVLGFFVDDGEQMYDYLLAPYPTGLDDPDHAILANADAIAEVVSCGFLDEDGERVLAAAAEMMEAQERAYVAIGKELESMGKFGEGTESFDME